jgi:hypothetical protein
MAGTLTISTLSDGTNSTSATNPIKGSAKAWINYNGVTQLIKSSYNISSVTYNSLGDYTLNFTNALTDADYCALVSGTIDITTGAAQDFAGMTASSGTASLKSTTQLRVSSFSFAGNAVNSQQMSVAVFR